MSEMLIVRHLGTPNSGFNGCHCMRDPVLYRSMVEIDTMSISHFLNVIADHAWIFWREIAIESTSLETWNE